MRASNFTDDLFIWSPQQSWPLILLALGIVGLGLSAARKTKFKTLGSWLLIVAVTCEVSLFAARWVVWSDPNKEPLFPVTAESQALDKHVGRNGRVSCLYHPTAHMAMTPYLPNTLAAYGIATITGYDSIVPNGMILPNETPGDAAKLGRLGVTHLITWAGNPDVPPEWNKVWSGPMMDLYANPLAFPRYSGFSNFEQLQQFLHHDGAECIEIEELSGRMNTRKLRVPAGITDVRIAENHAKGWQYRAVGLHEDWQNAVRADDGSMIMEFPKTTNETIVEMRYAPPMRSLGWKTAGISALICIGCFSVLGMQSKRQTI
jgi:disulfide bond formation protein DsbB